MSIHNNAYSIDEDLSYTEEFEYHLTVVSKQSGIVFIGKSIGFILGFLSNFILARYFGPTVMGQYALINTTVTTIAIFTIFGFDHGLLKYISRHRVTKQPKRMNEIIKIAFTYGLLFSIIGAVLLFNLKTIISLEVFKDKGLIESFIYGSWLIISFTLLKLLNGLYKGFKLLKYPVISVEIIKRIIFIIIIIVLAIVNYKSTTHVIISLFFSELLIIIYLIKKTSDLDINLRKILFQPIKKNHKSLENKKVFIAFSSTIIFINFMNVILQKTDKIMLGIYMDSEAVGIYNVAVIVASILLFLLGSSNMIFSSIISELFSTNKLQMLNALYAIVTKWVIILTLPVFVSILLFSDTILSVFGTVYTNGSNALIVLSMGQMINALVGANGYILNMCGYEKLALLDNVLMAIMNVILNVILIPKIGLLGAATATGFSIAIINIARLMQVKKLLSIFPYNKEYYSILLSLPAIIILAFLVKIIYINILSVIIITFINIVASILISYKLRSDNEKMIFDKLLRKIKVIFGK